MVRARIVLRFALPIAFVGSAPRPDPLVRRLNSNRSRLPVPLTQANDADASGWAACCAPRRPAASPRSAGPPRLTASGSGGGTGRGKRRRFVPRCRGCDSTVGSGRGTERRARAEFVRGADCPEIRWRQRHDPHAGGAADHGISGSRRPPRDRGRGCVTPSRAPASARLRPRRRATRWSWRCRRRSSSS